MANLSDLIVSGSSRLLNTLYCKDIEIDGTLHGNFTVSSPIISSVSSGSHINGAKGNAIINGTAGASYNMLFCQKSTNGVFNGGVWNNKYCFFYIADSLISAGTSSYTKYLTLLDESGNSSFPGTVTALNFNGTIAASKVTQDSTHRFMTDVCKTTTDWNTALANGFYMGSSAANAPSTAWYFGRVLVHTSNYVYQEVYAFTASSDAKAVPKYIRCKMNGTWGAWTNVTIAKAVPADAKFTDTIYTHSTASGYKHIPSGGSSGQFLKWSADGTAVWAADNNTTYSVFKAATSSAAGGSGLVPAPAAGAQTRYLRGDGTWQVPPDTKYTHPNSGVTAGTYRSITVNAQGHVTAGTNPTTLAGYGITDAAAKTHTHINLKSDTDNRGTNTVPNDYNGSLKCSGLKSNTVTGIPSSEGTYSGIIGIRGWKDSSGGQSHELAFGGNGGLYQRHGSTTSWGSWNKIYTSEFKPTPSEIGAAPSTATRLLTATATAAGWSASAPYSQTISVSGITSSDTPIIGLSLPTNTTVANDKAIKKAYGCLSSAVTNNGSITLYCASKKPVTNFTFFIKGI